MPIEFGLGDPIDEDEVVNANNIVKLLRSLVGPAQDVENAFQQLLTGRFVDTAIGEQLDIIGKIVGQPRNGQDDDTYRRFIRAEIRANRSDGVFEDLIAVAELVVGDAATTIVTRNEGTATARVLVDGGSITPTVAAALVAFMVRAKAAGVRIVTEWMESAPSGIFQFDDGPGWDVGHLAGDADH